MTVVSRRRTVLLSYEFCASLKMEEIFMGIFLCFIPFRIAILYVLWSHNIIFEIIQIIEKSINWSDP